MEANKRKKITSVSVIIAAVLFTVIGTVYAFKQFTDYSKAISLNGSPSSPAKTHYTDYAKTLSLNWGLSLPAEANIRKYTVRTPIRVFMGTVYAITYSHIEKKQPSMICFSGSRMKKKQNTMTAIQTP